MVCELNEGQNNNKQVENTGMKSSGDCRASFLKNSEDHVLLTNYHPNFLRWVKFSIIWGESDPLALLSKEALSLPKPTDLSVFLPALLHMFILQW